MAQISNQNTNIHYEVLGEGKPLVMCHGLCDCSHGWWEFGYLPELIHQRQVILIDSRGHGQSDKPHDPRDYSMERLVSDVMCVTQSLGIERFDYLGCSMGGWLGFAIAATKRNCLNSLIINGAHPYAQNLSHLRKVLSKGLGAWNKVIYENTEGQDIDYTRILNNDIVAIRALLSKDRPDLPLALEHLHCPILFLTGEHDPAKPLIHEASKHIPNSSCFELQECNHFTAITRAELSMPAITRFLQSI